MNGFLQAQDEVIVSCLEVPAQCFRELPDRIQFFPQLLGMLPILLRFLGMPLPPMLSVFQVGLQHRQARTYHLLDRMLLRGQSHRDHFLATQYRQDLFGQLVANLEGRCRLLAESRTKTLVLANQFLV